MTRKPRVAVLVRRIFYGGAISVLWGICVFLWLQHTDLGSQESVDQLVSELITTPERQQRALDRLMTAGMKPVPFMFAHLRDYRKLATIDVRFLNTAPNSFEKYYLTEAFYIDELTVRYLCGKTMACDMDLSVYEPESKGKLIGALLQWCTQQPSFPKEQCKLPAPVGKEQLIKGRVDP